MRSFCSWGETTEENIFRSPRAHCPMVFGSLVPMRSSLCRKLVFSSTRFDTSLRVFFSVYWRSSDSDGQRYSCVINIGRCAIRPTPRHLCDGQRQGLSRTFSMILHELVCTVCLVERCDKYSVSDIGRWIEETRQRRSASPYREWHVFPACSSNFFAIANV